MYPSSFRRATRRPSAILRRRLRYVVDRFLIITSVRRPTTALFILFRPALEGTSAYSRHDIPFLAFDHLPPRERLLTSFYAFSMLCIITKTIPYVATNLASINQIVFAPILAPSP